MKKYKRRRFLLFIGQISVIALIGSASKCSSKPKSKEKSKESMPSLKEEIIELIKSGKEITLKWNCGGDEAIITTFIDGQEMDYGSKFVEELSIYLINYLNLPDVGEISVEGEGQLIEDKGEVYIEYESIMKGYMDYGEKGEKYEWIDVNEKEDLWSGKKELFK